MRKLIVAVLTVVATVATGLAFAAPAQAAGGIIIYRAYYNSPGTDNGTNANLNAEYILLKNTATTPKWLNSWTLRDKQNHVYKFPATRINPGKYVYVRTGRGTNNAANRYWQSKAYIWNNTGDAAYLRNTAGVLIDSCSWGSAGSYKNC
jgi:lamin tail-like protein